MSYTWEEKTVGETLENSQDLLGEAFYDRFIITGKEPAPDTVVLEIQGQTSKEWWDFGKSLGD